MSEDCIFCRIFAGEAHAEIVGENEHALAILDINPLAEGHTLVISKRHEPWWHDLGEDESTALFALAREVARKLKAAYAPEFVTMYARGRRIPHTHVFLVPTHAGDPLDRYFNALEGFQEAPPVLTALRQPDALAAAAERIREARGK